MDIDSKNSKVFTDRKDFTIFQLFNMYVEGNIKLQPDYQRSYVYDTKKHLP